MPKPMFSLRLEPEVKVALERAAKADGRTVSDLMRRIAIEWLKRRQPKK